MVEPTEHGPIDATNRDFERYDQVRKRQTYRLAEAPDAEAFDEGFQVRTVDMGRLWRGDREAFSRDLGEALEETGFAILEEHGVDPTLHTAAAAEVHRLFEGHGLGEKVRFRAARHGSVNQGYFPIEETSGIHPDQVEGWVFGRRAFDLGDHPVRLEDFWPDPGHEPVFRRMCAAQEALVLPLMQSLLRYLGCDPHLYDRKLSPTCFALRLNYYPPLDEAALRSGAGRLLGHEDTDLFTLLPAPASEGLQVLERSTGRWVRLDAPPGTLVLNSGDYIQRITNDRLPSTTHRVSPPRDPALAARPRVSFPMNVYVREEELLEVLPGLGAPKYAPVSALEFHTRTTAKYYGDDYAVTDGAP